MRSSFLDKSIGILALLFPFLSSATDTYKWRGNVVELYSNLDEACQAIYHALALDKVGSCEYSTTFDSCEKDIVGTDPPSSPSDVGKTIVHFTITMPFPGEACGTTSQQVSPQKVFHAELVPDSFYLTLDPPPHVENSNKCKRSLGRSLVGDPINAANGAVIDSEGDCKAFGTGEPLSFSRFYDGPDSASTNLGSGWSSSFTRHIVPIFIDAPNRTYTSGSPENSSLYSDAASACTAGFAEIQSRVLNWVGVTSQYSNGICLLIKNNVVIGSIPVYSNGGVPIQSGTPISYSVIRDDGQVIRFWAQNAVLRSGAGISLRLGQSPGGYTVIDSNDTVESYDTNGVLQSITSRGGVTQTMSYDNFGRLSLVTDSFGHRLTFSYDTQSRLLSVMRQ